MSFIKATVKGSGVNPNAYHAAKGKRGQESFTMSPSALKAFAQCPSRWLAGYTMPDSDSKQWGKLMDARLLTPELFEECFAITPDFYEREGGRIKWRNDKRIKEVAEWMQKQSGKEFISKEAADTCAYAIQRLLDDPTIMNFHTSSDKQVHVAGLWQDDDSGLTVPVECLIDYAPRLDSEFAKNLGDLKTTTNAALMPFQRFCFTAGYHIQAAFDIDLYVAATGEDRNTWCFILQENYPPYQSGKRILSQDFLELGRVEYRKMLATYCRCLTTGKWPGYDDTDESAQGWGIVSAEPFMEQRVMFAPKFDFGQEEDEEPVEPEDTVGIVP